jgi:hypothetical protein
MLCGLWIEPLLGHKLINFENFRSKHGFFSFAYLNIKNLKARQVSFKSHNKGGGLL